MAKSMAKSKKLWGAIIIFSLVLVWGYGLLFNTSKHKRGNMMGDESGASCSPQTNENMLQSFKEQYFNAENPEASTKFFAPLEYIYAGQLLFSRKNVDKKIDKVFGEYASFPDELNDGKSRFPLQEAAPVILAPFGLVLLDGHHTALASYKLGAETLPVVIVADMSNLSDNEFWQKVVEEDLVFFTNIKREKESPRKISLAELERLNNDFPLRYYVAESAIKCTIDKDNNLSLEGSKTPLWVKAIDLTSDSKNRKDIPFIEFKIAFALREGGFEYDYSSGKPDMLTNSKASAILSWSMEARAVLSDEYNIPLDKILSSAEMEAGYKSSFAFKKYCPLHDEV